MSEDNKLYPWHAGAWDTLSASARSQCLSHALLISGRSGTGVFDLAQRFAHSLLCESPKPDFSACGRCTACGLLRARSHPDLLKIRPPWIARQEANAQDEEITDEVDEAAQADGSGREAKGARAGRAITIDQARALSQFAALGAHRGGRRVVLLYPAEALRSEASNALLKNLEEPTPDLFFLLVAERPHALMPTILSRCQKALLAAPSRADAAAWLASQIELPAADVESRLDAVGGGPLDVLALEGSNYWDVHAQVANALKSPQTLDPIALARSLDAEIKRTDRARLIGEFAPVDLRTVIGWIQRWITVLISRKLIEGVRYDRQMSLQPWLDYAGFLNRAARDASHPVNTLLFLEDCFARYPGTTARAASF